MTTMWFTTSRPGDGFGLGLGLGLGLGEGVDVELGLDASVAIPEQPPRSVEIKATKRAKHSFQGTVIVQIPPRKTAAAQIAPMQSCC